MTDILTGEVTCSVHLAATIKGLMKGEGGAIIIIREIQRNTNPVIHYCTCRLPAEFHLDNVGKNEDDPFPIFRG